MIFSASADECLRIPLGGDMEFRVGPMMPDEYFETPGKTPEMEAIREAKSDRDWEHQKRIANTKAPLSDEEVIEILEGTDFSTVEVNLLERMEKEQRNGLCRVILERIEERYRTDVEKIEDIQSLEASANFLANLSSRILIFCEHHEECLHDWPQILRKFYEHIKIFDDRLRTCLFDDFFDIAAGRHEFKKYAVDPLPNELIIDIVEFMLKKERGFCKKYVLTAVGNRLPAELLEHIHAA